MRSVVQYDCVAFFAHLMATKYLHTGDEGREEGEDEQVVFYRVEGENGRLDLEERRGR